MTAWTKIALTVGLMALIVVMWRVFATFPIKTSADAAAWLQAIGSVAAICSVFILQRRDHLKAEARELAARAAEEKDELETLMLFLVPLHIALGKANESLRKGIFDSLKISSMYRDASNFLDMVGNIRAAKLPSRRAAVALMAGQKAANETLARLDHIKGNPEKVPSADALQDLLKMLDTEIEYLGEVVKAKR